jgi:predicted TIM-barrel fold metal-dependent hydrolase
MHTPTRPTRRAFLRSTALAALAPAGCASLGGLGRGHIDAHVHVWTPDTGRYPLAEGFDKAGMNPASFTPQELFAHSKPEGVDRIVLIQMNFYKYDNRYMTDMMQKHRGVFGGVAIVDENQPDVCGAMKALAKDGVRGFRVYTSRAQAAAWGDGMKKMWTCAADHGLAICLLADPDALPAITTMCGKHPRTRVVIDHFARIGMKGGINEHDVVNLCRLADFQHVHVKTSAFYALGQKQPPYTDMGPLIRRLRTAYGADRLMWASDCPFQVEGGHTYADSIALIRDRLDFLTAEDKDWMLRKTAEKVFFS